MRPRDFLVLGVVVLAGCGSTGGSEKNGAPARAASSSFRITSPGWVDGGPIPKAMTCDCPLHVPRTTLDFSEVPSGTRALTCRSHCRCIAGVTTDAA
jgi:hypothetical protein